MGLIRVKHMGKGFNEAKIMKVTGFQPNFVNQNNKAETLLEKLASGKKVNSAADDAAGLQIINRLSAELDGYLRGSQNAHDGVSLAQTAESAYSNIGDNVARIRELSARAGSGAITDNDRQAIQQEINGLTEEITATIDQASFGGVDLLKNSGNIGISLGNPDSTDVNVATNDAQTDLNGLGLNAIDVTTQAGAQAALGTLDNVSQYVNTARAELGATQNRLDAGIRNLNNQYEQASAARARREDADFAKTVSERIRGDILSQSQIAVQGQANLNRQQALNLLA